MALSDIELANLDGTPGALAATDGTVTLVVNVASACGLTPQYEGLEALYRKYQDRGFTILAFPCNQFGAQEPGTEAQILEFCRTTYDVSFPVFQKIAVKDRKSTRLNSSHIPLSRMPSSA